MLLLFVERRVELTQREYDDHFDTVLEALEAANNETFRLAEPDEVLP